MAKGDYAAAKKIADPLAAYLERHKAALKEGILVLGGNPVTLTSLPAKKNAPVSGPFRDILQENDIQVGFRVLVWQTVHFLEDPRAGVQNNQGVQALLREIKAVPL